MSNPTRTPLAEKGEFPDAEVLVGDILAATELGGEPLGPARVDTDTTGLPLPALTCYAPPGRSSRNTYGDIESTFLYFDFVGEDRDQAKEMAVFGTKLLQRFRDGGVHKGVQIFRLLVVSVPTELPLRHTDDPRHREGGCTVKLRRHRGDTVHP